MIHQPRRPAAALQVDVIDTHAGFAALRGAWQALEQRDPQATVFLSWDWMAQAFRDTLYRWSVLVVRDPAAPERAMCILPLKYRVHWSQSRQEFQTELQAAGRLIWSEYTGFLCDPASERAALQALAVKLSSMPWVSLSMRYVAQPERCGIFTDALAENGFSVRYRDYRISGGKTDNLICPQVALPQDFDTYLMTGISRNRRQQYNRFKRRFLDSGAYRITETDADTFDRDLNDLLTFWHSKWRGSKGEEQAARVARNYGDVLTAAQRTDTLYMPVLRKGETALGALGHVVDRQNGKLHFIVVGRDETGDEPFIGAALHFHSIDWAIARGFTCYDFCHGDETYKYSYGAQDRSVLYFEARRKVLEDHNVLDSLGIGEALRRVKAFIDAGQTEQAAKGCAQLSGVFS